MANVRCRAIARRNLSSPPFSGSTSLIVLGMGRWSEIGKPPSSLRDSKGVATPPPRGAMVAWDLGRAGRHDRLRLVDHLEPPPLPLRWTWRPWPISSGSRNYCMQVTGSSQVPDTATAFHRDRSCAHAPPTQSGSNTFVVISVVFFARKRERPRGRAARLSTGMARASFQDRKRSRRKKNSRIFFAAFHFGLTRATGRAKRQAFALMHMARVVKLLLRSSAVGCPLRGASNPNTPESDA